MMLLGLANPPAAFMDIMNILFRPFLDIFVVVFIDDTLVYSKESEDNRNHIRLVLGKLGEYQLFPKLNKCECWLEEVKFLIHVISKNGLQ